MYVTHEVSRREGIQLGENIVVTVEEIYKGHVCLAIRHPGGETQYFEIGCTKETAELELVKQA